MLEAIPAWVSLEAATSPGIQRAGLRLAWSQPSSIPAPGWSGIVEEILISPGDAIVAGQAVAVIGGLTRTAATGRPLGRALSVGMFGPDVSQLNGFLEHQGLPHGSGDRFDSQTARGTSRFAVSIGAGPLEVFQPDWIVYLATEGATVETVPLTLGAPAPAPGATVASFAPTLVSAEIIAPVELDGSVVGSNGTSAEQGSSPSAPAEVVAAPTLEAPLDATVRFSDRDLALDATRRTLAPESLGALQPLLDPLLPYVDVDLVAPPVEGRFDVPAAAVRTGRNAGESCLWVRHESSEGPVPVRVVAGLESRSTVEPVDPTSLEPGDAVMVGGPSNLCD